MTICLKLRELELFMPLDGNARNQKARSGGSEDTEDCPYGRACRWAMLGEIIHNLKDLEDL